jgi:lyso-ornithine lipid O-acyltransferase
LRPWFKAALLLFLLLGGLALAVFVFADRGRTVRPERLMQWWCRRLLGILGVEVIVHGVPVAHPCMTVANHISWLDIPVIGAHEATRFVSKSEVRDWPMAGALATAAGTFLIRRGKGGAAPLLKELVPHLNSGGSVTWFPEGTTTDGTRVRAFHPRLFAAALESRCAVQPVALAYAPSRSGAQVAPFVDDDTLVNHMLDVLHEPSLTVTLTYLPAICPTACNRDALALFAESAIRGALGDTAGAGNREESLDLPVPQAA